MFRSIAWFLMAILCASWVSTAAAQTDNEAREKAVGWLKFNNKFGADSDFVRDMSQVIDESLADNMNVNFFFGSDLMDAGKYKTMHIYCGSVLSFELTPSQAEAMELGPSSASVTTSGRMGKRAASTSFELSDLQIKSHDDVAGDAKFSGSIRCRASGDANGEFALRVGYRANQGVGQFQWLDAAPGRDGTTIDFEFGPINDEDSEGDPFRGPVAVIFDIVSVDQSGGDVDVTIHSNAVGQIINVK